MIKEYQVDDKVSFKGNVEFDPVEETTVAWVNNDMYQAIIEHPDGHSGSEIPDKGLDKSKTYAFVKTDHLDFFKEEEEENVTDVAAEKVEEQPKSTMKEEAPTGPEAPGPADQPPVSESLVAFRAVSLDKYHPLIDHLISEAEKWEKKSKDPEEVLQEQKDREEAKIKKAEVVNEHAANRLKAQKRQRENIKSIIKKAKDAGRLVYGTMPGETKGVGATAIFDGVAITDNLSPDNEELADDELANYFQNTPEDYSEFVMLVVQDPKDKAKENAEKSGATAKETESKKDISDKKDADKSEETITYSKKEKAKKVKELSIHKDNYADKLLLINGIGAKTSTDIVKAYPNPDELVEAIASDNVNFTPRTNGALKKAFESGFFYKK